MSSKFIDESVINNSDILKRMLEPLHPFMVRQDQRVIDIMVNKPGEIWLEMAGQDAYERVKEPRVTLEWASMLCTVLANLSKRVFSPTTPFIRCSLPGFHRFTGVMGPSVSDGGVAISIRVKRKVVVDLEHFGLKSEQILSLRDIVERGKPILISGGMGTGKTVFLNELLRFMPDWRRTVLIEDVRELDMPESANYTRLELDSAGGEGRLDWSAAINLAMRLNGRSFVCSELTIENALPVARVMTSGHASFMMTMHASSPLEALMNWGSNYEISSGNPAGPLIRRLARVLDSGAVIQLEKAAGGRRVVSHVVTPSAIAGIESALKSA